MRNPTRGIITCLCAIVSSCVYAAAPSGAAKADPKMWNEMQYGSLLSATFENRKGSKQFTNKGIAIAVGTKEKPAYIIFDTELLRYSAAWTDPGATFLTLTGVPYDGSHGPMPSPRGKLIWAVKGQRPGISLGDNFDDPREIPFGPLPRDQYGHYKGLYRYGEKVVLSYEIAGCEILETPTIAVRDGEIAIVRQIQLSPSDKTLNILACEESADGPTTRPAALQAGLAGEGALLKSANGLHYVAVAPHKQPLSIAVAIGRGEVGIERIAPPDFAKLCKGGASNWPEKCETKGVLGEGAGPYVVDTLTIPEENPYKSWMRMSGIDFFPDGRAAVATLSGDVWIVSGIDAKLDHLAWKRFAAGLFQPLGLKIVNNQIYVTCRDQINRLSDLNGDGEADYYENFNNDCMVGPYYHEFAFDLQRDSKGYFYYAKGGAVSNGGRGWMHISPHNGTIMRVSPDGQNLEIYATGVRAPNGMSMGPHDELTVADNEGTWTPACRISFITKGAFLGVPDLAHTKEKPTSYGDPICWLPHEDVDNSSGGGVWVTDDRWGPFKDRMLHTSYGMSSFFLTMIDRVDDVVQGGVVRFPNLSFDSGIGRGRIGPLDGQVYLIGLKGWDTNAAKDGCFQRVRYTGKPADMPTSFHVKSNGIEINFTDPVDPETAGDLDSYDVEQWNYIWSKDYGSPEVHIDSPQEHGRQSLKVTEVRVAADKKSIFLTMPDIQPVMQMKISMNIDAADGATMKYDLYTTINKLPGWKPKPAGTRTNTTTKPTVP